MIVDYFYDYYEFYYFLKGECIYFIKDCFYYVRVGDFVFVDWNVVYKILESGRFDYE